jgi:hypothetical protein
VRLIIRIDNIDIKILKQDLKVYYEVERKEKEELSDNSKDVKWADILNQQLEVVWKILKSMKLITGNGNIRSSNKLHNPNLLTDRGWIKELYQEFMKMSKDKKEEK